MHAGRPARRDRHAASRPGCAIGRCESANDVYFKIGLLTIIGLAAKNAILIVEFAVAEQRAGRKLGTAVVDAARLRLRPILMTSFCFILGVLPLAISTGAGANARHAIGTGVIGGMLFATFLGVLLIPVFYVFVRRLLGDKLEPAGGNAGGDERSDSAWVMSRAVG